MHDGDAPFSECTVLDYSSKQIESELLVAEREGYHIDAIEEDMTKNSLFQMKVLILYFTLFQTAMWKMWNLSFVKRTEF